MLSTRCCKNMHSLHGLSTEVTVFDVSYVHQITAIEPLTLSVYVPALELLTLLVHVHFPIFII